jgi:hypothetical protein
MGAFFKGTETEQIKAAAEARYACRQRVDGIRADMRLTDEAKRAAIAREYLRVKKEIQGLQIAEKTQRSTRWNELAKNLFGLEGFTTAQDAISYQDAQDRVDSIPLDGEERSLTLLRRVELSGDKTLCKGAHKQGAGCGLG